MSNIIPPLLSDTPPPVDIDDHEEDEFGDIAGTNHLSYDYDDNLSPPGSPLKLPTEPIFDSIPVEGFDINSNNSKENMVADNILLENSKDVLDKRKNLENTKSRESIDSFCQFPNHAKNEIFETNCDTKTTPSQGEISGLSIEDDLKVEEQNNIEVNNADLISNDNGAKLDDTFSSSGTVDDNTTDNGELELNQEECQSTENVTVVETVGDFFIKALKDTADVNVVQDLYNDNDDFGDFQSLSFDVKQLNPTAVDDDDNDEFGEFIRVSSTNNLEVVSSAITPIEYDDDFGDFTESSAQEFANFADFSVAHSNVKEDENDFGEFASTSQSSEDTFKTLLLNEKQALEKSTEIIKEMFPPSEPTIGNFESKGLEVNDKIFNLIKNITDTHALSYQWSKSASQNLLLKALNIDPRNILDGYGWNPSMPRFAANLSFTPLQPVKSEILTPTPAKEITNIVSSNQSINTVPLELQLINEPIEPIQTKEPPNLAEPTKEPLNIDQPAKIETISNQDAIPNVQNFKTDLEQKTIPTIIQNDDFDEFVSYSSPTSHGHSIILRETHISNKEPIRPTDDNDIVSWLEPTIVTPELTRKERQFVEAEEDFDDFQMVVVPEGDKLQEIDNSLSVKPLEVVQSIEATTTTTTRADDDFGDFTCAPVVTELKPAPPAVLLEPLKPSVVPQVANVSASISWPDPGITDDEIGRFEALGYSRTQNKNKEEGTVTTNYNQCGDVSVQSKKKANGRDAQKSKQNSLEEEEWSDFVSVQNSSPVHKLKSEKERSSTPDLPLSVLNLGNVQPAKQPIPVITPNGLFQTKLSSNMTLTFPNMMQQTNRIYPQPQPSYVNPAFQPSIISNQFANQAYGGFNTMTAPQAPPKKPDDDEWSDFVSHQPTVQKSTRSQPNHMSSWIQTTPNIIANPTAMNALGGGPSVSSRKVSTNQVQGKRSGAVTNVTVPDLDFLSPRNRTSTQPRK